MDHVLGDHLHHEGPSGRVVEGHAQPPEGGDDVDRGERRLVHEGQARQDEGLGHGPHLDDEQQPALVAAVSHQPGPGPQDQHRGELAGDEQSHGDAVARQVEHQQGLSDQGEPVPDLGDPLAHEEEPEVPDPERRERLPRGGGETVTHGPVTLRLR